MIDLTDWLIGEAHRLAMDTCSGGTSNYDIKTMLHEILFSNTTEQSWCMKGREGSSRKRNISKREALPNCCANTNGVELEQLEQTMEAAERRF